MKTRTLLALTPLLFASTLTLSADAHTDSRRVINSHYGPRIIHLSTPREGVLLNSNPRCETVRSFTADSGGTPFDTRSPLPYGAPVDEAHELAIVRTREAVPYMAISPWEPITDRTIDELRRNYPWIRRTGSIRQDLILAQNQYLRERGYVGGVRGFTNQSAQSDQDDRTDHQVFSAGAQEEPASEAEPQLIIRESSPEEAASMVRDRLNEESVIRASPADETRSDD